MKSRCHSPTSKLKTILDFDVKVRRYLAKQWSPCPRLCLPSECWTCTTRPLPSAELPACLPWTPATSLRFPHSSRTTDHTTTPPTSCQVMMQGLKITWEHLTLPNTLQHTFLDITMYICSTPTKQPRLTLNYTWRSQLYGSPFLPVKTKKNET